MRYCSNCGAEIDGDVCPFCGTKMSENSNSPHVTVNINNQMPQTVEVENSGLKTAAKVFMVLGIIASGWMIIPLAWTIPMTVSVFHDFRDGRPVGIGLKICSLLFVSLIGGILLLCINDKE